MSNRPTPTRPRLPEWLRSNVPDLVQLQTFNRTRGAVEKNELATVCEEARCPNKHECWSQGTATFMVAGEECTRGCRFCSVKTLKRPDPLQADEPQRLADAAERMNLDYVVITVVNRDDQPDGGADHYKRCVQAVKDRMPMAGVELLSSDLAGNWDALSHLLEGVPLSVFAHNVECVPRMERKVRDPRASFTQSEEMLRRAKKLRPDLPTKTSLMVGVGETDDEVLDAMQRVRDAGVDLLTLGQYIAPGKPGDRFLPVDRYVHPDTFAQWTDDAYEMGFKGVAAGPLVRSSFRAGVLLEAAQSGRRVEDLLTVV